jgi:hypothetical protein
MKNLAASGNAFRWIGNLFYRRGKPRLPISATLNVCLFVATQKYLTSCEHTQRAHNVHEVSSEMAKEKAD